MVDLDEDRGDVGAPRVVRDDAEQVASLAGTHADDANRAGRSGVEQLPQALLDNAQALGQRAIGIVVLPVPGLVVANRA